MKTIMISVKPRYAEQIMNGKKTIEVRKFYIEPPFKVVNYVTKAKFHGTGIVFCYSDNELYRLPDGQIKCGDSIELMVCSPKDYSADNFLNGKVAFEYVVNRVDINLIYKDLYNEMYLATIGELEQACLTQKEIREYGKGKPLYAWYISDLKIYDKPKELSDFYVYNKELEKRFIDGDGFCCYDGKDGNGEPLTDCSADNIKRCYQCWEEWSGWCKRVKRPPQNFIYVEEMK